MFCKECLEPVSPDCMLTNDVCVFCHYNSNEWESNGRIIRKKEAILHYKNIFKGYINYYKKLLIEAERLCVGLPKGSYVRKNIKNHWYYYLVYREGKLIKFDYIGKNIPSKLKEDINKRKKLKKTIAEIKRVLFVLGEIRRPATRFNRYDILERDKFICQCCGRKPPEVVLEVDHIMPVSKGGSDEVDNLKTICRQCNSQKRAKYKFQD